MTTELPNRIGVDDLPNSPARRAKKKRQSLALPKGQRECDHQAAVIRWARDPMMLHLRPDLKMLFHIPNGGLRSEIEARRLIGQGVKPGVSDLFLAAPAHGFHGLWIEMKAEAVDNDPSKDPTPEQVQWLDDCHRRGYATAICWEAKQAIDTIEEYLDGKLR